MRSTGCALPNKEKQCSFKTFIVNMQGEALCGQQLTHHPSHAGGPAHHVPGPHILVEESIGTAAHRGHMRPANDAQVIIVQKKVRTAWWNMIKIERTGKASPWYCLGLPCGS